MMIMMKLAGISLLIGGFSLYYHLQKDYIGVRPAALQIGCLLISVAGAFLFFA